MAGVVLGQGQVWGDAGLSLHHTKADAENVLSFKSPIPGLAQGQGTCGNNELGNNELPFLQGKWCESTCSWLLMVGAQGIFVRQGFW